MITLGAKAQSGVATAAPEDVKLCIALSGQARMNTCAKAITSQVPEVSCLSDA